MPKHRRLADLQMDVAGAGVDRMVEQGVQIHLILIGTTTTCFSRPGPPNARQARAPIEPAMAVQPLPPSLATVRPRDAPSLGGFRMQAGQLTAEGLEQALAEQERSGLPLGQVLIGLGLITTRHLAEALAEQHGLDFIDLGEDDARR